MSKPLPLFAFLRTHMVLITSILVFVAALTLLLTYKPKKSTLVGSLFLQAGDNLKSDGSRTNVLLMGIGGEGHESPDLTDSMIFISFNHTTKKVVMVSIPRDIWLDSLQAKVNTAFHYGEENGSGMELARSAIAEVLGQPVHYVFVLDFNGFTRLVDVVGGVDVEVVRSFDDYKYPIPGKENAQPETARYEHLHFDQGLQHMNGVTALKYVRSRHALGDEGTDFARSRRQQQVLLAFKNKVLSHQTLLSPTRIQELSRELSSSITTDIRPEEYASFLKLALGLKNETLNLTPGNIEELLANPTGKKYGGAWVLVPIQSWESIHAYVKTILE